MDINYQNLISVNEVLSDVLVILGDIDQKLLTPGFYLANVRNGLDELAFDINFLPMTNDYPLPIDLIVPMPVGCFDLQNINIFSGTPDDVQYIETVYWRKGVQTRGYNTGTIARINPTNYTDHFAQSNVNEYTLYYFSVQNGLIRLSDACKSFDYVRLTYNGLPSVNLSNVKMVPPECRKALVDWTVDKCAGALKLQDAKYRTIQFDTQRSLDEYGLKGSWHEAKMRLVRLDKTKLRDVVEYNSKLNF
jgi:hypothetical protein